MVKPKNKGKIMKKMLITLLSVLIGLVPLHGVSKSMDKPLGSVQNTIKPSTDKRSDRAILFEDGFENYTDFAISFAPWTMIDNDGSTTYGIGSNSFPNAYYVGSFILFNPINTSPALSSEWAAHSGIKYAACFSAQSSANNDWIISPQVQLTTGNTLKFWVKSRTGEFGLEKFNVGISTTGTDANNFTIISGSQAVEAPIEWTEFTYDLTAYASQNVHVGIQCVSHEAFVFLLDDISILDNTPSAVDVSAPMMNNLNGVTNYTDKPLNITATFYDATGIASVAGHYQIDGQSNWIDFEMNANKTYGVYSGVIPAQANAVTGKVKFTSTDLANPLNTGDSPETTIAWMTSGITSEIGEGFEGDVFPPVGWTTIDLDGGNTKSWATLSSPFLPHSGMNFAVHEYGWSWEVSELGLLITPSLSIKADATEANLKFWESSGWAFDYEYHGIFVSTTNNDSTSFSELVVMPAASTNPEWIERTVDLSAYKGQTIYLAFKYKGLCADTWLVDDVKVIGTATTGIENKASPTTISLSQNYPNPFNPATTINFTNNQAGNVKLTVMNAKGETVATLINNNLTLGNHSVNFDGSKFNSGVYFYQLTTPNTTITKKMLLVK